MTKWADELGYQWWLGKIWVKTRPRKLQQWIGMHLPARITLWAFTRVYAYGMSTPGPDYASIYTAWKVAHHIDYL